MELLPGFHGYGLLERRVIEGLRSLHDPYPYVRGMIYEVGFEKAIVHYTQPLRKRGITKNNFYTLYDIAMLGITNFSKVPLRIAAMLGFAASIVSLIFALIYLIYKIVFWNSFPVGVAPLVIGLFFFASVQLFFIGILGEYIGAIHTQVLKRPLVVEKERINF
jgi:glycosyltransferase involved in cell wall biosynthesis